MNHIQRQLIKEAYQEGYQEALHENRFKNFLRRIFGFDVDSATAKAKRQAKKVDKEITRKAKAGASPDEIFDSKVEQSLMKAVEIVLLERQKIRGRPFTDDEILELLEEFGIGYLFDDFKRFIDPPGVIGKIGFDDLP